MTVQRADAIIRSLHRLLDSKKTQQLEFSFFGPAHDLLVRMQETGTKGLPSSGEELCEWLRLPPNAKLVRQAGIAVSFPPNPARRSPNAEGAERPNVSMATFIKLERGAIAVPIPKPEPLPF
jgi:hypothetical protein